MKNWHRQASIFSLVVFLAASLGASGQPDQSPYIGRMFSLEFIDHLSGEDISVGPSHRGTLIVYWSYDCMPCVQEMPELNRLYAQWKSRGIQFVGIPLDQRPERILAFCRDFGIQWPQFAESDNPWQRSVVSDWGIEKTPSFILLDAQGRVADWGFDDPEEALEALSRR